MLTIQVLLIVLIFINCEEANVTGMSGSAEIILSGFSVNVEAPENLRGG